MKTILTHSIFSSASQLPENWNALAMKNIFLSKEYLEILEKSAPINMRCFFIGFFDKEELVGIGLSQFLDLNLLQSFGERDKCVKASVRNFIFKNFCSHVLLMGNNMLTGQNSFAFSEEIDKKTIIEGLLLAMSELKSILKYSGKKTHITSLKDFELTDIKTFEKDQIKDYFQFSTQPNMIFTIPENWNTEQDYIDALSKKYRDQYKRARKKADEIEKRKLNLEEIIKYEEEIYELYFHVAKNAPFNTFFLAKNHFSVFKEILNDKFLFYGYFLDGKLIGFNTLIKNGDAMDTYFLGYDDAIQKDKMLYLNMLYDMIAYSIKKGFREIVFARTALEIKSSVGAKPMEVFGYIKHESKIIDRCTKTIFNYLEPKTKWKQRNPFKD
ncbi:GNAT family N-acetyltransferase [Flavobacterium sp.]|uniref:GNAT family N-acetyltransferase n=1 Tax=Flavobacterium sp. TaxID=239 RepID=UPI003BBA3B10